MVLDQIIGKFLIGTLGEDSLLPQIRCQIGVGTGDGSVGSLGKVTKSSGTALSRGVAIFDSGHGQKLLRDGSRDNSSSTRRRNQADQDRSTFACDLRGHGVGFTNFVSPKSTPHWDNGQLCQDDCTTDGSSDFLRALKCKIKVLSKMDNYSELFLI